ADDPRFISGAARRAHAPELIELLDQVFATKTLAAWRAILDGNGLIFGVVATLDDVANDRQMRTNEELVPFVDDTMLTVNSPFWIEGSAKVVPRYPPELGEHTNDVLRENGFDDAEIRRLRAANTVA